MDNYMTMQVFSVAVSAVLLVTFYVLAAGSLISGANMITPMLLIINSVIMLAILSMITKMAKKMKA